MDQDEGASYNCGWTDTLGFKVDHNPVLNTTKLSAPKHIDKLKEFVKDDVQLSPKLPHMRHAVQEEPYHIPDENDPDYVDFINRKQFMYA
eukprot:5269621-Prymnesium_polylepis.1